MPAAREAAQVAATAVGAREGEAMEEVVTGEVGSATPALPAPLVQAPTVEELKARLAAPLLPMLVPVPPLAEAGGGGGGDCSIQLILRYPAPCRVVLSILLTTNTKVFVR